MHIDDADAGGSLKPYKIDCLTMARWWATIIKEHQFFDNITSLWSFVWCHAVVAFIDATSCMNTLWFLLFSSQKWRALIAPTLVGHKNMKNQISWRYRAAMVTCVVLCIVGVVWQILLRDRHRVSINLFWKKYVLTIDHWLLTIDDFLWHLVCYGRVCGATWRLLNGNIKILIYAMWSIDFVSKNHAEPWCRTQFFRKIIFSFIFLWPVHGKTHLLDSRGFFHLFQLKMMQNDGVKPEKYWNFHDHHHGKWKMRVSVDIANYDARLGQIKSSHTGFSRNT